jgi:hypothetical protein
MGREEGRTESFKNFSKDDGVKMGLRLMITE